LASPFALVWLACNGFGLCTISSSENGDLAGELGFEPRFSESESAMLH